MAEDSSHKAIQHITFECSILFSNNKQDNAQIIGPVHLAFTFSWWRSSGGLGKSDC